MNAEERYINLINELIEGIDSGDFSGDMLGVSKYRFEHLEALFMMLPYLDGGEQLYDQIYDAIVKYSTARIKNKVQVGEKIKIYFIVISAAEWSADELYNKLKNDEYVDCKIIISPLIDRDKDGMLNSYHQVRDFFAQKGYDYIEGYHLDNDKICSFESICESPDIIIHLTPWYNSMPESYRITQYPLHILNCYIPYGTSTGDSVDGSYMKRFSYNKEFMSFQWRIYADSMKNLQGYQAHSLLKGKNVRYSGYAKMDRFLERHQYSVEDIKELWKIPDGINCKEIKKVIIAPHHSFLGYAGIRFSTFKNNAHFLYYLAEKYKDEVSFVLKPHPSMRVRAVEAGVFADYTEYDAYIKKWNDLPNARVVQESDYLDIFETSDGMIMDSISFLAEYLYLNKPLLFLQRQGQAFTQLGKAIVESYYTVKGEDYSGIEKFLQEIILNQNDVMEDKRKKVFEDELNYYKYNGCSACEYIYKDIREIYCGM